LPNHYYGTPPKHHHHTAPSSSAVQQFSRQVIEMNFEIVLLPLFSVCFTGDVHPHEDAKDFEIKRVTGLFDLAPFFVGSIHHDWVLINERDPLEVG
jgi:hypothetical protein